ncbi:MAG: sigma 54-interacting transcriptional regulator [bacterium]
MQDNRQNITIKKKIILGFSILMGLIVIISLLALMNLNEISSASRLAITRSLIVSHTNQIEIAVLECRRAEKNFWMRKEEKYIERMKKEVKRIKDYSNLIRIATNDKGLNHQLDTINILVDEYYDAFMKSGKELLARAIHYHSQRKEKPFISLDCSALTESLLESELFGHVKGSFTGAINNKPGLFEVAHGGTFFLDEIGETPLHTQVKLLRVLQEREIKPVGATKTISVDIRLITATNKNLEEMIKKGTFREDLFYRLNVVPIFLPPLRERREDIPLLASHILKKCNLEIKKNITGITSESMSLLEKYDWHGNVRELENVIEKIVVMIDEESILPEHLPLNIRNAAPVVNIPTTNEELRKLKSQARKDVIKNVERLFVVEALKRNNWNVTKTADDVGMKRQNLQTLIRKYQIEA